MQYAALFLLLCTGLLLAGCTGPAIQNSGSSSLNPSPAEVRVDALIPLSGVAAPLGESSYASMMTAADDINRYYQEIGSPARVRLMFHDTESDPGTTFNLTEEIHASGGTILAGYITSAGLSAIKEYTDTNGMLVLSSGSTAPSLAIPNDSIYRVVSDDTAQGQVMGSYLSGEGITAIVPLWRGDVYGDGLKNATATSFASHGGEVLEGVRFLPGTTDFHETVASLDLLAGQATGLYGAGNVGIYAVTFSELSDIMDLAPGYPNLSVVRWFGGDGNAGSPLLAGSTPAGRFAEQVNLTGTIWGIPGEHPESDPVVTRIRERLGREPDGEAVALYDTLWVIMAAKGDIGNNTGQTALVQALNHHLDTYSGVTLDLKVNAAGDREMASYSVLQVVPTAKGSVWKKVKQVTIWPDGEESEISFQ